MVGTYESIVLGTYGSMVDPSESMAETSESMVGTYKSMVEPCEN